MALDKILKIYDGDGNEVDYDILANDVKFQDGVDLPTKIAGIEQEIEDIPGYEPPEGGIPATDLSSDVQTSLGKADTAYQKPASGIPETDLAQGVQDSLDAADSAYQKPASGIPSTDMAQAVQDALDDAGTALQPGDLKTVNSQSLVGSGDISIPTGQDGKSAYEIAVNEGFVGDEEAWLESLKGQPGEQGPQGNVQVDGDGNVLIVNNLTDGGAGAALSALQGKILKDKINEVYSKLQAVYSALANLAFTNGKTDISTMLPDLDWGNPKHSLEVVGITNAVVTKNGEHVVGSLLVEEGETIQLVITPAIGYAFTSAPSATLGLESLAVTAYGENAYSVEVTMGNANATLTFSGTLDTAYPVTLNLSHCSKTSGPTSIITGGGATFVLQAGANLTLPSSLPVDAVTGATVSSYTRDVSDDSSATLVLTNVTGPVGITLSCVPITLEKGMFYGIQVSPNQFAVNTTNSQAAASRRACLTMVRDGLENPCTFSGTSQYADAAAMALYSAIPIPNYAQKISIKCNAEYYYFIGLADASGNIVYASSAWVEGSTTTEFNLSDYPTATHFAVSFKIGSGGTTNFSNETYESMGIDFNFVR